eukprot:4202565-Pleurochrysis_carterae.AAC.1
MPGPPLCGVAPRDLAISLRGTACPAWTARSARTSPDRSRQSQIIPRAHGCMSSCPSTLVGTSGTSTSSPPARVLSAATA